MTMQYQSYLLASSPPGFELLSNNWLERRMFGRDFANNNNNDASSVSRCDDSVKSGSKQPKEYEFKDTRVVARDKELDKKRIKEWKSCYDCNLESCGGHGEDRTSKKVLFADDAGKILSEVKVSPEPTDVPPSLSLETIKKIEETIPGFVLNHESSEGSAGHRPTFTLLLENFKEPQLDLMDLHNRVENLGVTLAGLSARPDKKLGGSIEIKTPSHHNSSVCLRYTVDRWKTSVDEEAGFVSDVGGTDHSLYGFECAVPLTGMSTEVEFAICHRSTSQAPEQWDNNNGANYKIICIDEHDSAPPHGAADAAGSSQVHRVMSAPGELTMWGVHDFEDALQPYW